MHITQDNTDKVVNEVAMKKCRINSVLFFVLVQIFGGFTKLCLFLLIIVFSSFLNIQTNTLLKNMQNLLTVCPVGW